MSINGNENKDWNAGLDILSERKAPIGVLGMGQTQELEVTMENMITDISRKLSLVVSLKSGQSIDSKTVEDYLISLVVYRIMQIEGNLKMRAADVYVPCFFYPVLAGIGKFEDPRRALRISPTTNLTPPLTPDKMSEVGFMLATSRVKVERGLPRILTVDSDSFYRVESTHEELRVAGDDVGELILLIRTVVNCEFSAEIFGSARTRYLSIEDATTAWDAILGLAVE